jgi:heat shock protein HslJ
MIDASNVTLVFGPAGRVFGSGGCNHYNGAAELTGEGLRFGPLAATMMACPEALMAQEGLFFQTLDRVDRFDISPDGALLLIAAGETVLTARR